VKLVKLARDEKINDKFDVMIINSNKKIGELDIKIEWSPYK